MIIDITVACICAALILLRCGYRLLSRCRVHASCHRRWHAEDAYMAFALLPLAARTTCIALSFKLNPSHSYGPATDADAAAEGISTDQLQWNYQMSHKLLIPARISYALLCVFCSLPSDGSRSTMIWRTILIICSLWSLKLCILNFYSRFMDVLSWGRLAKTVLSWFIVITFVAVVISTLCECRPLSL